MPGLAVELKRDPDGPPALSLPVSGNDLVDALSEAWWEGYARAGCAEASLEGRDVAVEPIRRDNAEPYCDGFVLRTVNTDGKTTRCVFPRSSVAHVAQRGLAAVRKDDKEQIYYDLRATPTGSAVSLPSPLVQMAAGLAFASASLPELRDRARTRGEPEAARGEVFYTERALADAERISRRGAASEPPVETGGLLIGPLCRCPETRDVFVVVTDVLEATDTDATTFSLAYSSATWAKIDALLRARRSAPGMQAHRILGQTHGHNFLPLGGLEPCEACAELEFCTRHTAFLSTSDLRWCRAVFSAQPWQLSHQFGLNARGENVDALFGLRGGCLTERGFRVIPDFEPTQTEMP